MYPALRPHLDCFRRLARQVLYLGTESKLIGHSHGSGILLTDDLAVTANHVVKMADCSLTTYATRFDLHSPYLRPYKRGSLADVVWQSERRDLAIVRLRHTIQAVPASFSRLPPLVVGQPVLRLGYDKYGLAAGYIHGFQCVKGTRRFTASLAASPGTSGGPLFDFDSYRLVGIVTHAVTDDSRPSAAHGTALRMLFTALAKQEPGLYAEIIACAAR